MSAADPLATYRPIVLAELRRQVDALPFSYAEMLRQAVATEATDGHADALLAAPALCLLTVEACDGGSEAALTAATSLALVQAMARAFGEIGSGGADSSLEFVWGFPRSLNAGDAFFALAQSLLLQPQREGLDEERAFAATRLLDTTCRKLSEALFEKIAPRHGPDAASATASAPLLKAAVALGALLGGARSERLRPACGDDRVAGVFH